MLGASLCAWVSDLRGARCPQASWSCPSPRPRRGLQVSPTPGRGRIGIQVCRETPDPALGPPSPSPGRPLHPWFPFWEDLPGPRGSLTQSAEKEAVPPPRQLLGRPRRAPRILSYSSLAGFVGADPAPIACQTSPLPRALLGAARDPKGNLHRYLL